MEDSNKGKKKQGTREQPENNKIALVSPYLPIITSNVKKKITFSS